MITLRTSVVFEWDSGNIGKNKKKHGVDEKEAEEAFFDAGKVMYKDTFHSLKEERYIMLGETKMKRLLFVVFTKRKKKIRIISARDVNRKEVSLYEKKARGAKIQK